jgi:hypothetical protein
MGLSEEVTSAHTNFKERLRQALRKEGCKVEGNLGGSASEVGRSDLTVCAAGRYVAIEVKTGKGTASPAQQRYLRSIWRAGGSGFVARDVSQTVRAIRYITAGGVIQMEELDLSFLDEGTPATPTSGAQSVGTLERIADGIERLNANFEKFFSYAANTHPAPPTNVVPMTRPAAPMANTTSIAVAEPEPAPAFDDDDDILGDLVGPVDAPEPPAKKRGRPKKSETAAAEPAVAVAAAPASDDDEYDFDL